MTLSDFILARIAEDEAHARWRIAARESVPAHEREASRLFDTFLNGAPRDQPFDPARVLAEVEAKRQRVGILNEMERDDDARLSSYAHSLQCREALPYADHPGYREEWKP